MATTLPTDPKFRRLVLAHVDLEAALSFADVLLADKRRRDRDRGVIRESLVMSMIAAYSRPFKTSHGDGGLTAKSISLDDIGPFSEYQVRTHNRILGWRDQIVAHGDPGPRQLRFEVSPFFGNVPMMRDTTFRITSESARDLRGHIHSVLTFVSARLAVGGISGVGFEW